jgi:DNA-binding NarL/FixJ family response regulator
MDRILIIDDEKDMQLILSDTLKLEGYETIIADDGESALKSVQENAISLALLDVKLPGMNGLKVLEEIKKIDKNLIVIMLTGYGHIKDAVKAIKLGAFDYITKPFKDSELIATIKNALQSRHSKFPPLSFREKEVLKWLKKGKSSWEISEILNISYRTVDFHVNNIIQKLDAVNRIQAVAIAVEHGLIDEE